MKNVLLTLIFCFFCTARLTASPADNPADRTITGQWVATEGVGFGPWTFNFVAEGNRLTGTVSQGHSDGKGWSTGLTAAVSIAEGFIDGNTITFNVVNPQASNRRINFKGCVDNDRIVFEREVVFLGAGPLGRDGIYGKDGARQFEAKRVSYQPVLLSTPSSQPNRTSSDARPDMRRGWRERRNVSGTWVAQNVPNGPWTVDLRMAGRRVTGTVKQASGETRAMEIFDGSIDGPAVFFKAKSPDGARTITFSGMVNGNEMTLLHVVEGQTSAEWSANGVCSASAPAVILARREPGTMIMSERGNYRWRAKPGPRAPTAGENVN